MPVVMCAPFQFPPIFFCIFSRADMCPDMLQHPTTPVHGVPSSLGAVAPIQVAANGQET